jgi:hypothetical protein
MNAKILIGRRRNGAEPVNLYTGLDGVALQKAADEARASGEFEWIAGLTNPASTPYPADPTPTTSSGAPSFPKRKPAEVYKRTSKKTVVEEQQDAIAAQRKARLEATGKIAGAPKRSGKTKDVGAPPATVQPEIPENPAETAPKQETGDSEKTN